MILLIVEDADLNVSVTEHETLLKAIDSFVEGTPCWTYNDAIAYCIDVGLKVSFGESFAGVGTKYPPN